MPGNETAPKPRSIFEQLPAAGRRAYEILTDQPGQDHGGRIRDPEVPYLQLDRDNPSDVVVVVRDNTRLPETGGNSNNRRKRWTVSAVFPTSFLFTTLQKLHPGGEISRVCQGEIVKKDRLWDCDGKKPSEYTTVNNVLFRLRISLALDGGDVFLELQRKKGNTFIPYAQIRRFAPPPNDLKA